MSRKRPFLTFLALVSLAGLVVVTALATAAYQALIKKYPGEHIEREYILSVLARESPIYASDRTTKIGAFFGVEHRDYVTLDRIPVNLRHAIVSSEDKYFYKHPGFNPIAIAGAMLANLRAGKAVRGGSTITQQTAKNLYNRQGRSLKEKLRELSNALKLEAHYSKDEILEFYLNQFHVNANGRGVGVAARHFFDKDVSNLDLVECAFIAGSVKGPMLYDPFSTTDPDRRDRNIRRANGRKDYVIRRMLEDGYITKPEFEAALAASVPFRQGQFRFERSVIVDMVQREMASEELQDVLTGLGGTDLSSSGLQIFTSIDVEAQKDALYAVRGQLSRMKLVLEGAPVMEPVAPSPPIKVERGDFLFAVAGETGAGGLDATLRLGSATAYMDRDGIAACTDSIKAHQTGNQWSRSTDAEIAAYTRAWKPGQIVPVIVRREPFQSVGLNGVPNDTKVEPALVDCAYPYSTDEKLQGALVALDDGFLRAVVGGFLNSDFNRAVDARRQPGSAFKPLVYYAAVQLGWSPSDLVRNRRELYRWGQVAYRPKSDHLPQSDEMSLAWVATSSENYGSVWMLAHLTDKLTDAQFAEVAAALGLGPAPKETPRQTAARLRDKYGVVIRKNTVREAAFETTRTELLRETLFAGDTACAAELGRMTYEATDRSEIEEAQSALAKETSETRKPEREADEQIAVQRFENLVVARAEPAIYKGLPLPLASCTDELRQKLLDQTYALAEAWGLPDGYDPAVWRRFRDFRMTVNVNYVIAAARTLGFQSQIEPVFSLPLGTSDVTLSEMAHFYETAGQGFLRGDRPRLITEVRTADGDLLWAYNGTAVPLGSPKLASVWLETLRNVSLFGTAKGADDLVTVSRDASKPGAAVRVPFFGKTGTTNRNQNVYFVGLFPRPDPESKTSSLSAKQMFTVAAYAGYDDNRPLAKGRIRIYGSSGALPMVVESARGIIDRAAYPYDPGDLSVRMAKQLPLEFLPDFITVSINATTGLPDEPQTITDRSELDISQHPYLVLPGKTADGKFEPERLYEPLPVRAVIGEISPEDRAALEKLLSGDADTAVLPAPEAAGNREPPAEDRQGLEKILESNQPPPAPPASDLPGGQPPLSPPPSQTPADPNPPVPL